MRRSSKLILALYTLSALLHAYVGARLLPNLLYADNLQPLLIILLLASTLLIPAAMIKSRQDHSFLNTLIIWSGLIFMGFLSSLIVFTLVRDGLILSLWLAQISTHSNLLNDHWLSISALLVVTASLLVSLVGFINIWFGPRVVNVEIPIIDLPSGLQDFSIVQLTDIHIGPTIKHRFLRKVVQRVNSLKASTVVITGDLVDGRVQQLGREIAPLADLQSDYGTFFVTGNHEYYSNAHEWIALLQQIGVRVLINEHEVLQHNDTTVVMAGVADFSAHHFDESHQSDPMKALQNTPEHTGLKVLLAHQPRSIFQARGSGAHIQLSGHTHGGQFWPWNYFVPLQQPFTNGLHWFETMWIYVSRGTGYWGPPKRFGAPAEITLIRFTGKEAPE